MHYQIRKKGSKSIIAGGSLTEDYNEDIIKITYMYNKVDLSDDEAIIEFDKNYNLKID